MSEKFGVYIHIPFCVKKCNYCDFVSYSGLLAHENDYIKALSCEMQKYAGTAVDTIYLGGGTPSLLSEGGIEKLVQSIKQNFRIDENCEMTLEINPATVNDAKMRLYHSLGFNRVSIGIQSFDENELSTLGRIHTPQDGIDAVMMAKNAGISNISIDIMYGFSGQNMESLKNTLKKAISIPITHISCYGLRVEKNTPFGKMEEKGEIVTLLEDTYADMYEYMCDFLKKQDFTHYEISNFCKNEKVSNHNMKYWRGAPYIGLGVAAHSYFNHERRANTANFNAYLENPQTSFDRVPLTKADEKSEYIITALRLKDGFSLTEYQTIFENDFSREFARPIEKFSKLGLLKIENERCFLPTKAFYVSNSILCEFVLEE